jgi:hypothetical protein
MLHNTRQWMIRLAAVAAVLCLALTTNAFVAYRMVAASGIQAPGAPPGATFTPHLITTQFKSITPDMSLFAAT